MERIDILGLKLRTARKAAGITQSELASRVGLSAPSIRLYEMNKRSPSKEMVAKIAKELGVAPQSLYNFVIEDPREVLEFLFRLEDEYGLKPISDGRLEIIDGSMNNEVAIHYLRIWQQKRRDYDMGLISRTEYETWKNGFTGKGNDEEI